MNLAFHIARRYLVSKKSHNIINIISVISVVGVMVGTMALIIVLSVFNGFESLVKSLFNSFDPDLKITLVEGKTFEPLDIDGVLIQNLPGVIRYTEVIEETCLLKYQSRQTLVTLKGVGEDFEKFSGLDSMIVHGDLVLERGDFDYIILGYGVAYLLGANLNDHLEPISVFAPKRKGYFGAMPDQAFTNRSIYPSGIFSIQQDFDSRYSLVPLRFARELFAYDTEVTSIEIGLRQEVKREPIKKQIRQLVGERFVVKDRYEQQELLYKIMRSEKLAIFLILTFILFIATFNTVGTLSMLILDKKKDIAVLHSMGANEKLIKRIFFTEGLLISLVGALLGMLLGTLVCCVQIRFGIVSLQTGAGSFVVDAYPVEMLASDFLYVFLVVMAIGLPAAWFPANR
ncbi:MAG: FtsX-like permease family protein, partial [Bacteroidales bacterium]|nr:FtsX-like permease family protein [Bacteroidales bacterium]